MGAMMECGCVVRRWWMGSAKLLRCVRPFEVESRHGGPRLCAAAASAVFAEGSALLPRAT